MLCVCGLATSLTAQNRQLDSLALVDFYNSMNGPGWTNKTNWLTGSLNTWYGVTLNGSDRVSGVALPGNQVRGTFPASFMNLTALQTLNLSNNAFGLILPANLNQLTGLTTLLLNSCGQTALPSLAGLVNLTTLNVTNNSLTFEDLEPIFSIPGIIYSPQASFGLGGSANIVAGNPWAVSLTVGGSANQYQWYKGGVPVGAATTSAIAIPAVIAGDAGTYQLRVTSTVVPGITLSSSSHLLTVVAPGAQNYFTWPNADGIINDTPSDSYGGYWADIDNDGDDDLAIGNLQASLNGRSVDLYENNNGVFSRLLTAGMPTDDGPRNMTWADYDNDGDLDFYLGDIGLNTLTDQKGAIYRNEGNKTFTKLGLDHFSDGGVWADYDNDGFVDLFIVDAGQPTVVYRNQGNGTLALSPVSFALGSDWMLAFADIDNDRDQDFVQIGKAPNTGFNSLQRNDSAGAYTYLSADIISTDNLFSARGGSWADIDNDGDMDFFAMNSSTAGTVESAFYRNDGSGTFSKQPASAILGVDVRGRSASFGDLDNDGDVDLAMHNGKAGNTGLIVFLNNGTGTFTQVPLAAQTFIPVTSVTLAQMSLGDANSDGFLDIFSANFNVSQPPSLYRNVGNSNHWVKFKLQGTISNRAGVGARIEIFTPAGKQIREVTTQTGLAAQNSLVQHFGIAGFTTVDTVKVYWPSGLTRTLTNVAANQILNISEIAPQTPINQTDSLALVAFYTATNGASWTNKTNWLIGKVETWYGVVVSDGRVTEINLPSNNLTGSLPNLSALTGLTKLAIPFNLVQNGIPATLNNLTSLEHLDLRSNRFTGIIPSLISLTNLKYFSIGANSFLSSQAVPTFIFSLTQLEYLGLDNNRLTGLLPTGFNNLPNLKELNISTTTLAPTLAFFTEIGTLQNMERLLLAGMNMGPFDITPFTGLPVLQLLDVRGSSLASLPGPASWASGSLLTINASNNLLDFGDLEPFAGVSTPVLLNTGQNLLPFFGISSTTLKLLEGDRFNLVSIFGGTQNNYQWYFNSVAMPGQTGPALNLSNIEMSEAGTYRLQMTNNIVSGLTLTTVTMTVSVVTGAQMRFAAQQSSAIDQDISANSYGGYWADIDRDGDEDLFVNNAFDTNPNFLYRNNGDGTFTKETAGDIVTVIDRSRYVSWGDYDNDGFPDIFVGDYQPGDNISSLYHNNGDGTFSRTPFNHNADGGLWADYDNDGGLDLSVNVTSALPVTHKLYKNNGDGTFELIDPWIPNTTTFVAGWVDMDNDLDADYFLTDANSNPSNIRVFKNDTGSFVPSTLPLPSGNYMVRGASWADIDGDGDMDLFAENSNGNISSTAESQFYINDGAGQFTMVSASSRAGARISGARGSTFGDADNDGDLDLFVVHKYLSTSADVTTQLFLNNGSGFFSAVPTTEQFFGFSDFGTNLSLADYDNDGSLDLFIGNFDNLSPNHLFRNLQAANGNHWIKLNLVGMVSNKSAIGARIDIYAGANRMNRQVQSSSGLSGQNSMLVHAGLGAATQADSVVIYWPSGVVQRLHNLGADQTITIEETTTTTEQNSSNIVFSNVTTSSMHVAFTPGSGSSRLVIARPWNGVNFVPTDSTIYTLGQQLANGNFVMYIGDSSHFDVTNIQPDTDYFLEIFEVNPVGGFPKYRRPGATATQKTLPAVMWGSLGAGPGQFQNPFDLEVLPDGSVVAADLSNQRIQKFTAGGGFLWQVNDLVNVNGVGSDQFGNIYCALVNGVNVRITKFDSSGNLVLEFGEYGNGPGQLLSPQDVDVDLAGNIYVLNLGTSPGQIKMFNSAGEFVRTIPGTYQNPIKMDIDNAGNIIVTDFRGPMMHLLKLDQVGNTLIDIPQNRQYGVDVDSLGYMYTSNDVNEIVYEYSASGSLLHTYGGPGLGFGQFNNPYGLSSNRNATKLYVADQGNHRIQVIDITKLDQFIAFDSVGTIQGLSVPYSLNATALGSVPVQFSSSNDSIASVSGNQLTFHRPGTVTITAFTLGTHEYKPGMTAQIVSMLKLDQLITSTPIPFKAAGEAPFPINATSTSGLPVEFTSSNPAVATVVGNMVWVWEAGTTTIVMTQPGNASYLAAPEVTQELTVYPALDLNTRLVSTTQLGGNAGRGTIVAVDADWGTNTSQQVLHEFDSTIGFKPSGQLLPVADGFLYGTTSRGGAFDRGSIYRIKPDGSDFSTLHTFDITNGGEPYGGLIQASDGDLYGTTASGGLDNFGTVFRIKTNGSGFTKLHDFNGANGQNPYGRLIQATNGYLYGTTVGGGVNSVGTIFRIRTDGTGFELLYSFDEVGGNSSYGGLTQAANGKLYGAAYGGGGTGEWVGSVFRIELDGSAYTKLHTFDNGEDGKNPLYGGYLTQGRDGSLYGTTHSASASGGTVFRMANDSTFSTIRALAGSIGTGVVGAPVIGSDGTLYALALYGGFGYGSIFGVIDGSIFGLPEGIINKVPLLMIPETGYYPFLTSPTITYTFRASQTLSWDSLQSPVNLGSPPIHLTATLSSGLTPEYRSSNTSVAVVEGDSLRIVGAGSSIITAFHVGNSQYKPTADSVSRSITVVDNIVRPNIASTNLSFTNVFSTQLTISFSPGNGEKHLVAIKAGSPFNWEPVDGERYYGSTYLPNAPGYGDEARIISADSSTSIHVTGLDPNVTWYVKVFEFNSTHYPKYLVTSVLSGSRSTLALPNVYVVTPADGSTGINVTTNVTSRALAGASTYTIQLSSNPEFSTDVVERSGARTQNFTALAYDTVYYSRVRTDLSPDFGPTRSFRTGTPDLFSYVTSPANNATGVVLTNLSRSVTANLVIGAILYTIELDTSSSFSAPQTKMGGRTLTFTGLAPNTTYFSRVRTDLSSTWGQTRQFTTAAASLSTYVVTPGNNATNVSYQPTITVNDVGATTYSVELSPLNDFSADVISQTASSRTMAFTGLLYNTKYYSRARTELDSAWGPLRSFTTNSPLTYSYVTSPANNAINVNYTTNITAAVVPGATTYTIEANTQPDFLGTSIVRTGGRTLNFTLGYNQIYYVRVQTDLLPGQWGASRTFSTNSPLMYSYMTSPANNAVGVPYVTNITANTVPGATTYTIEANTLPDFTGTSIIRSGGRTLNFTLGFDQVYYVRVQTDLMPGEWGPQVRSFSTNNPLFYSYMTSPVNGATNVSYVTNITANTVPTATTYIIEANTQPDFSGASILKMGTGRTYSFTLAHNQTYYVRVQTNLMPGEWGSTIRSFTTGDPVSLAFVTSPANGAILVPTTVNVTANVVSGATSYTIELNTNDTFTGTALVLSGTGRTKNFSGLAEATTYYSRVSTNLTPGLWGPSRSFSTINPGGRQAGDPYVAEEFGEVIVTDQGITVRAFPNPFVDRFEVHVQTPEQEPLQAVFTDLTGRELFRSADWMTNRIHSIRGEFSQGIYLLELKTGNSRKVIRVVRQ